LKNVWTKENLFGPEWVLDDTDAMCKVEIVYNRRLSQFWAANFFFVNLTPETQLNTRVYSSASIVII
jgi:hypothetical protein